MEWIVIISGGPGGSEYITTSARNRARRCEVLVGSRNQLTAIEPLSGQKVYEETDVERIMEIIEKHKGREVGVVVTGDAGIYSLAQRIIDRFGKESVKEIIPGVSSIQVAFARIKEPWVNVRVFSYHGRPLEGLDEILTHERVAILCDREHNSKVILRELTKHGLFEKRRDIHVC
ncbi:MAG: precorrin-6y C5,15-methyltransferase (decarboxylating) subunit CbiE, partial [Nitrospirae bacterium]|nr:precorrin-6y C5,15-methyltransferase (decarboxylating) subunit CbiE [Nitrospirota bacterium]